MFFSIEQQHIRICYYCSSIFTQHSNTCNNKSTRADKVEEEECTQTLRRQCLPPKETMEPKPNITRAY